MPNTEAELQEAHRAFSKITGWAQELGPGKSPDEGRN